TEGTIELDGRVISAPGRSLPPEKRGMSMIFQSYAIWPNMTVAENVGFGLEVRRLPRAEIRRLHDEFHITTVYVTHDQAEAMVTSDRIAVMNQGRIEQVDEPRALYARPRTRFVAGFIGRTNFLDGEVRGDEVVIAHCT